MAYLRQMDLTVKEDVQLLSCALALCSFYGSWTAANLSAIASQFFAAASERG